MKLQKTATMKQRIFAVLMLFALAFLTVMESSGFGFKAYEKNPVLKSDTNTEVTTETSGNGGINDLDVTYTDDGIATNLDKSDATGTWNTIFKKYKGVIVGVSGIATLTFIILFIVYFMKVGANADNPTGRRLAVMGVLWTGIAAACCGAVTVITALFWNALK